MCTCGCVKMVLDTCTWNGNECPTSRFDIQWVCTFATQDRMCRNERNVRIVPAAYTYNDACNCITRCKKMVVLVSCVLGEPVRLKLKTRNKVFIIRLILNCLGLLYSTLRICTHSCSSRYIPTKRHVCYMSCRAMHTHVAYM